MHTNTHSYRAKSGILISCIAFPLHVIKCRFGPSSAYASTRIWFLINLSHLIWLTDSRSPLHFLVSDLFLSIRSFSVLNACIMAAVCFVSPGSLMEQTKGNVRRRCRTSMENCHIFLIRARSQNNNGNATHTHGRKRSPLIRHSCSYLYLCIWFAWAWCESAV